FTINDGTTLLTSGGLRRPWVVLWGTGRGRAFAAFWLMGLLNNAAFVILNAGAKDISAGGVGLVYVSNVVPSLMVKTVVAPLVFHRVSYEVRIAVAGALTMAALGTVALGSSISVRLVGVACGSVAGGIGECSFLAITALFEDGRLCLTAWSSGTGFAGVFGYTFVLLLTGALGLDFDAALIVALLLPAAYIFVFFGFLNPERRLQEYAPLATEQQGGSSERAGDGEGERPCGAVQLGKTEHRFHALEGDDPAHDGVLCRIFHAEWNMGRDRLSD
ncbi:Protein btn-1, partial [Durusdinium trenchii]